MMADTKKVLKKTVSAVLVGWAIAYPIGIANKQTKVIEEIKEKARAEYDVIYQEHELEAERMLKKIDEIQLENESLVKKIQQLEQKNKSLEGVRSTIINSVGYFPSDTERDLLERLVECEAGGESLQGKIAVANVVINRVKSNKFPNSITNVIYQKNQFEPVVTGIINKKVQSSDSKEAVKRAFMGEKVVADDIVNFWASWLDKSNPLWNHIDIVTTIGVHHFGRGWE